MINPNEEWVQVCEFNEDEEICFTQEYLELTNDLGGVARKFIAHLITDWDLEYQTILDYTGNPDLEEDEYSLIDGEPMSIDPDRTDLMEYYNKSYDGLEGDWYRDILLSKLITLKLPKRLIKEYVEAAKKELFG